MTDFDRTKAIADLSAVTLPALLATAGLDNFVQYINKSPLKADDFLLL
jgi:hypothetical protein